jgi:aryl-alcohol dehydrogenase-like predicted oxidoreductase
LSPSQVALLWTLQQTFVTTVIVGVQSVKELEENMACINNDIKLTDDEVINFFYTTSTDSLIVDKWWLSKKIK